MTEQRSFFSKSYCFSPLPSLAPSHVLLELPFSIKPLDVPKPSPYSLSKLHIMYTSAHLKLHAIPLSCWFWIWLLC